MVIFHSYVKLPEGTAPSLGQVYVAWVKVFGGTKALGEKREFCCVEVRDARYIQTYIQDWENLGTVLGIIGGICPDVTKTLENHPRIQDCISTCSPLDMDFYAHLISCGGRSPVFSIRFPFRQRLRTAAKHFFYSLSFECRLAMASHVPRTFGTLCQRCPVFAALRRISRCLASSKKVSRRASRRNRPHHLGRD